MWPLNEHMNPQFDDEWDIRRSSKNYEENGYEHNLNLLIVLH